MKKILFPLVVLSVFFFTQPTAAQSNFDEKYILGRALQLADFGPDENYKAYKINYLSFGQEGESVSIFDRSVRIVNLIPPALALLGSIQVKFTAPQYKIIDGCQTRDFSTFKRGVRGILGEAGIKLAKEDRVEPSLDAPAVENIIKITRVEEAQIEEFETLPYQTEEILDSNLERGIAKIEQAGSTGKRRLLYSVRRENGIEVSKKLISNEIVKPAENKIVRIGTKIVVLSSISGEASWTWGVTAMRKYKRGTLIRVTNLANGKSVETRVGGWGPQIYTGRILDLAHSDFEKIADLGAGKANVLVEELKE